MRFECTTGRGEVVNLRVYRNGDATLTVKQANEWRTAFMSAAQMNDLRCFLAADGRDPVFVNADQG